MTEIRKQLLPWICALNWESKANVALDLRAEVGGNDLCLEESVLTTQKIPSLQVTYQKLLTPMKIVLEDKLGPYLFALDGLTGEMNHCPKARC